MHAADFAKLILRSGKLWKVKGVGIAFLLVFPVWVMGQHSAQVNTFVSQGRTWKLLERTVARGDVQLILAEAGNETILSAEMAGENYFLQAFATTDDFTLIWLHFHQGASQMAVYRQREGRARLLGLNGFRSFPQVEIFSSAVSGDSLFFLGERDGTVDLFHYDLDLDTLTQLTDSVACEKDFSLEAGDSTCTIRVRTLAGTSVIAFDPRSRQVLSRTDLPKKKADLRKKTHASSHAAAFYNTYVGFGDSITWGQISQTQHPEECFLNQIKLTLTPDWGEVFPINLGLRGSRSLDGAERVEDDLEGIDAQYFLLMYGVNDVWRKAGSEPEEFSLASCKENIAFMVDAAKTRGMNVIVSTLTPRKDLPFVLQDYYWQNLQDLSDAILALAIQKEVAGIDTLTAFLDTDPPDGWKDLLEEPGTVIVDGEEVEVKGNHPNALGHRLIADLFVSQFNVIHSPDLTITEFPAEAYSGQYAHFAAQAAPYDDATIMRIEWSFSNESGSEIGETVDHKMQGEDETVTVTATAIDSKGRKRTAAVNVFVSSLVPPVVVITDSPSEAYAGESAHFAAKATPYGDATIVRIEWKFSNEGGIEIGAAVDHVMKGDNEVVTVTATAIDSKGLCGSAVIQVMVHGLLPPEVVITAAPAEAYAGESAHFAAQATPYRSASIVRIEWTFSNESGTEIGAAVDHVMKGDNEVVTVTATAIDSKGLRGSAVIQLMVRGLLPPVVAITAAPAEAYAGEIAHFAARAIPYRNATIVRIEWAFSSDSSTEVGEAVDHRMAGDNQVISVSATAIDSRGLRGSAVIQLMVRALYAPAAAWRKIHVRTLFYDRDVWEVTWTPDPRNAALGFQIVRYWVYRIDAQGQGTKIATVEATAPLRIVDLESSISLAVTYAVAAVDASGHASPLPSGL